MNKITVTKTKCQEMEVKYLQADCGVRYWEDAKVNGVEDTDGTLIPLRFRDRWRPLIDLDTGVIEAWPSGTVAEIHYKVCDDGTYTLLNEKSEKVAEIDGYVPEIMAPGDNDKGFGDYVVMNIDGSGKIANWEVLLNEFDN